MSIHEIIGLTCTVAVALVTVATYFSRLFQSALNKLRDEIVQPFKQAIDLLNKQFGDLETNAKDKHATLFQHLDENEKVLTDHEYRIKDLEKREK